MNLAHGEEGVSWRTDACGRFRGQRIWCCMGADLGAGESNVGYGIGGHKLGLDWVGLELGRR
jgi:hypothetical protein